MKQVYQIDDPVYGLDLFIFIGSKPQFHAWLKRRFCMDMERSEFSGGESFIAECEQETVGIVWMPDWDGNGLSHWLVMVHELNHIAFRLFGKIGIETREGEGNEAHCYYHEMMCRNVFRALPQPQQGE